MPPAPLILAIEAARRAAIVGYKGLPGMALADGLHGMAGEMEEFLEERW